MNSKLNHYSEEMGNVRYRIFKAQQFAEGMFDVIFYVEEKKIYAHKCILGTASTTFQSMFSDRWNPDKKVIHTINIHEYSYEIFYKFIRYLYSGTNITLNDESVFKYAELAEYYNVVPLREDCFTYLRLAEYDAAHFIDFAEHYFNHPTYSQAFRSGLMKQYPKWVDTPKFLNASKELVLAILDSDRPYKHEEHLFRIVYKWARKNAENFHEEYEYHFMDIDNDDDCEIIEDSGISCKSISSSPVYKLDSDDEMNVDSNDGKTNRKIVDSNESVLVTNIDTVVIHNNDEGNINDVSESDEGLITDSDDEMDIDINGGKNDNINNGKPVNNNESALLTKSDNGVVLGSDKGSICGVDNNGGKTNRKLPDSNKSVLFTNEDVVLRNSIPDTDNGMISEIDDGMLPDTDEEEDDCVILDEINPRKPKIPTFDEFLLNELKDILPKFHFNAMGKQFISSFVRNGLSSVLTIGQITKMLSNSKKFQVEVTDRNGKQAKGILYDQCFVVDEIKKLKNIQSRGSVWDISPQFVKSNKFKFTTGSKMSNNLVPGGEVYNLQILRKTGYLGLAKCVYKDFVIAKLTAEEGFKSNNCVIRIV